MMNDVYYAVKIRLLLCATAVLCFAWLAARYD